MQPFQYTRIIHIIVVHPSLVAGVVRWIDVNTFDPPFVFGKQGFQRFEVIAVDDPVSGACKFLLLSFFSETIRMFEYAERHIHMMVDYFFLSYPVEGWHFVQS